MKHIKRRRSMKKLFSLTISLSLAIGLLSFIMPKMPAVYAAETVGILNLNDVSTLTIYDNGEYSLDNGQKVSDKSIGPQTELVKNKVNGGNLIIKLANTQPVYAKYIHVLQSGLEIRGPGKLILDNQNQELENYIAGIRTVDDILITQGAQVETSGSDHGVLLVGDVNGSTCTVTDKSTLVANQTGTTSYLGALQLMSTKLIVNNQSTVNATIMNPSTDNMSFGITTSFGIEVSGASTTVRGNGGVGVHSNGTIQVSDGGKLYGTSDTYGYGQGVQGDRSGIKVYSGGLVEGTGVVYGVQVTGADDTSRGIYVNNGELIGIANDNWIEAVGVNVDGENSNHLTVENNGSVTGTGNYKGVRINSGNLSISNNSVVEGNAITYGMQSNKPYGGVIINGSSATATVSQNSKLIENYSKEEAYDTNYITPYKNDKNITDYRNYDWKISKGTGRLESDSGGNGIRAKYGGKGTMTATRTGDIDSEFVDLDTDSSHIVNIPVVLSAPSAPTYNVIYHADDATSGSLPNDDTDYEPDQSVTVKGKGDLIRNGYNFIGWSLSENDEEPLYNENDKLTMEDSDIHLYAKWKAIPIVEEYNVIYHADDATSGTVPVDNTNYKESDQFSILGNGTLKRDGYSFVGWTVDENGNGSIYKENDTLTMGKSNIHLYAKWTQILEDEKYMVIYHADDATAGEVPVDETKYKENEIVSILEKGTLEREGHRFVGWTLDKEGKGAIYNSSDTLTMGNNHIHLYAKWVKDKLPDPGDKKDGGNKIEKSPPETGDNTNLTAIAFTIIVSSFVIATIYMRQRNKE